MAPKFDLHRVGDSERDWSALIEQHETGADEGDYEFYLITVPPRNASPLTLIDEL